MENRKIIINSLTVLASLLIALAACEVVLIAINWSPQKTTSEYLQFGYSTGIPVWDEDGVLEGKAPVKVKLFQYDEELFWKTIPDTEFTNSQGFRGKREVSVVNRNDAVRILILGDSCSFLGRKLYADFLLEALTRDYPESQFEIINASVPGYTSFQGQKLLKRLMQYKPHYACIYFGWNDHWILPSGYTDQFHYELIHSFKVVQLVKIMMARIMNSRDYRVPPDSYRVNLTAMLNELKANGVIPVMIAAPSGYAGKEMPRWAYDFYREYYGMTADEIKSIPATHNAYANIAARVAEEARAVFVDAQGHFNRLSTSMTPFFRNDLIHLTEQGHQSLAQEVYRQMILYNSSNHLPRSGLIQAESTK